MTARYKVTDAKTQRVEEWPCMRFDPALLAELEAIQDEDDFETARDWASEVLHCAHVLSIQSTRNELDRLPDEGWRELNKQYFEDDSPPDEIRRGRIWVAYLEQTETRFGFLFENVREAETLEALRGHLAGVQQRVQPAVATTGHMSRALPWLIFSLPSALAVASLHADEYKGDLDRSFKAAIRYEPVLESKVFSFDRPPPVHWDLLQKYAPVIIQEQVTDPPYSKMIDHIGSVEAVRDDFIQIDAGEPEVYAYARDVLINDRPHVQLVYTYWYAAHPVLKEPFDPEAGSIEGLVLRITLDDRYSPSFYETVSACGCYHRMYPTQAIERAAMLEFGTPEESKRFAIERNVKGKIDLIVPKLVDEIDPNSRPVIRSAAGHHAILDVCHVDRGRTTELRRDLTYELQDYKILEHLSLPDGRVTSMFHDNGLVKGAQRPEGVFFTPIGILSAGQPRQRGTQLIHWDHWFFDDPKLFEKTLRLPRNF